MFLTSLLTIGIGQTEAFQQVAGPIVVNLKPGETKTVQWGLVSDKENDVTVVELKADGSGAEFLSFPKTLSIDPSQLIFVDIIVTIPKSAGNVELNPTISATEFDHSGGAILLNIQMKKTLSIIISSQNETKSNSKEDLVTKSPEETNSAIDDFSGSSEEKGGGCLIATATFGSELAPQIQQLRELRDSTILTTQSGTAFMTTFNQFYYSFAPTVADWERQNPLFKEAVKIVITPMISTLSILNYVDIDSESKMVGYGIGVISLNIGIYFIAPSIVILRLKQRKK